MEYYYILVINMGSFMIKKFDFIFSLKLVFHVV